MVSLSAPTRARQRAPEVRNRCFTPPTLGDYLGVTPEKIIALIKRGEIEASNLTLDPHGRPRWVITPEAVQRFLAARRAIPPTPRQKRRRKATDEVDYLSDLS